MALLPLRESLLQLSEGWTLRAQAELLTVILLISLELMDLHHTPLHNLIHQTDRPQLLAETTTVLKLKFRLP
jgi:hypothetical protein